MLTKIRLDPDIASNLVVARGIDGLQVVTLRLLLAMRSPGKCNLEHACRTDESVLASAL